MAVALIPSWRETTASEYLERAIDIYYLDPWFALWRSLEASLIASCELKPPVLDIGCGDGLFSYLLWSQEHADFDDYKFYRSRFPPDSFRYSKKVDAGIDLNEHSVQQAGRIKSYTTLAVADACSLPYQDDTFNTAFSNCVMEHIPDLDAALREVARVLKSEGVFLITVPSERFGDFLFLSGLFRKLGLKGLADRHERWVNGKLRHFHTMSHHDWRTHLEGAGFHLVDHCYYVSRRMERCWSIAWMLLGLGWGRWTLSALTRQVIYLLDASPSRLHKRLLKALWTTALSKYVAEDHPAPYGQGGALFLIAQRKAVSTVPHRPLPQQTNESRP
ncbi:MAG: class I SAM-dependent methyltransferase [Chloroflexi bacterium]|nr:class I SAM-dependent methyltransferase [Chloroflexota bacterium]